MEFISYLEYKMKAIQPLNRLGETTKTGMLLKYKGAFTDYMPWEEFGDLSLSEMKKQLASGNIPQFLLDNFALSLLPQKLVGFKNHVFGDMNKEYSNTVKLKYFNDIKKILLQVNESSFSKIRIDFNNGLSLDEWRFFEQHVQKEKLDFVEDPFPNFDIVTDIPVASDFNPLNANSAIKVFKPLSEASPSEAVKRVIYTHSMGHNLGCWQAYLRFLANKKVHDEVHGLYMPGLYFDNPFLFEFKDGFFYPNLLEVNKMIDALEGAKWIPLT